MLYALQSEEGEFLILLEDKQISKELSFNEFKEIRAFLAALDGLGIIKFKLI